MQNGSADKNDYATLAADLRDIQVTLYGDARRKIVGMVETLSNLADAEEARVLREAKRDFLLRGIVIGLGLTGLTSASTLVALLTRVLPALTGTP